MNDYIIEKEFDIDLLKFNNNCIILIESMGDVAGAVLKHEVNKRYGTYKSIGTKLKELIEKLIKMIKDFCLKKVQQLKLKLQKKKLDIQFKRIKSALKRNGDKIIIKPESVSDLKLYKSLELYIKSYEIFLKECEVIYNEAMLKKFDDKADLKKYLSEQYNELLHRQKEFEHSRASIAIAGSIEDAIDNFDIDGEYVNKILKKVQSDMEIMEKKMMGKGLKTNNPDKLDFTQKACSIIAKVAKTAVSLICNYPCECMVVIFGAYVAFKQYLRKKYINRDVEDGRNSETFSYKYDPNDTTDYNTSHYTTVDYKEVD